jgi:hypothetical protein
LFWNAISPSGAGSVKTTLLWAAKKAKPGGRLTPAASAARFFASKIGEIGEEPQLAGREGVLQLLQEQPSEQPREDAHRQEEAGAASDPAGAVK